MSESKFSVKRDGDTWLPGGLETGGVKTFIRWNSLQTILRNTDVIKPGERVSRVDVKEDGLSITIEKA